MSISFPQQNTVVYCNFNQLTKLDRATFNVWMNILSAVPNSVLWLLKSPAAASERLLKYAKKAGIATNRIIFSESVDKLIHLQRMYKFAHLLLDTPIYNAHTSAGDALWAGVPILTVQGATMPARVCSSMLLAFNKEIAQDLIVHDLDTYEARAIYYGQNTVELLMLREKILNSRAEARLFDTELFVKNFEKGLARIWSKYEKGEKPEGIHADGSLSEYERVWAEINETNRLLEEQDNQKHKEIQKTVSESKSKTEL